MRSLAFSSPHCLGGAVRGQDLLWVEVLLQEARALIDRFLLRIHALDLIHASTSQEVVRYRPGNAGGDFQILETAVLDIDEGGIYGSDRAAAGIAIRND